LKVVARARYDKPSAVKAKGNGEVRVCSDDQHVTSAAEIDGSAFRTCFDRAVLIHVRIKRERCRIVYNNTRHIVALGRAPFYRVETSALKTDLEFARDVLPFEVRARTAKLRHRDRYKDHYDHENDQKFHYGLTALISGNISVHGFSCPKAEMTERALEVRHFALF